MTSNERKIIKCLWGMKDEAHIRAVSDACGLTSDYTRFLCKSLARAGYLEFADANICRLLEKGRSRFDASPAASEPVIVTTSADAKALTDKSVDEALDKALADLEPSAKKDEGGENGKPEF